MALTSLDAAIAATKQHLLITKLSGAPAVAAGFWASYFAAVGLGTMQGALAIGMTGAGEVPTKDSAGAAVLTAPGTGKDWFVLSASMSANIAGIVALYDRVWHGGSFSAGTGSYGAFSATSAFSRYGGEGLDLWVEVVTATSALSHTLTASVEHNDLSTANYVCTIPTSQPVGRAIPFTPPASAQRNIRRILSLTGSGSNPTGTFNVVAKKPIITAGLPIVSGIILDPLQTGLTMVDRAACLCLDFFNPTGATAPTLVCALNLAEG